MGLYQRCLCAMEEEGSAMVADVRVAAVMVADEWAEQRARRCLAVVLEALEPM